NYRFRSRAACNGRWRKDREISIAAGETIETDLAIPNGCEFAAQEIWRGTVLGGRRESVDNADARFRLERGDEIVEQGVRLLDLVIHVHQNRNVDRFRWQLRIVWLTKAGHNVVQPEIAHLLAQALQILGHDIFRDDLAVEANNWRQPYHVIAATRANIRDCHPGLNPEQTHDLSRFAGIVALFFVVPDRADNVRHRAIGFRKGDRRHARLCDEVLRSA